VSDDDVMSHAGTMHEYRRSRADEARKAELLADLPWGVTCARDMALAWCAVLLAHPCLTPDDRQSVRSIQSDLDRPVTETKLASMLLLLGVILGRVQTDEVAGDIWQIGKASHTGAVKGGNSCRKGTDAERVRVLKQYLAAHPDTSSVSDAYLAASLMRRDLGGMRSFRRAWERRDKG
jgi:hypothetical protein